MKKFSIHSWLKKKSKTLTREALLLLLRSSFLNNNCYNVHVVSIIRYYHYH
nr:MAG TPA: hypothetical protein [Caudoviricetes sp.]